MRTTITTRALAIFCIVLVTKSVAEMDDEGSMAFSQAKPRLRSSPFHPRVLSTSGDDPNSTSTKIPTVGVGFFLSVDSGDVVSSASDEDLVEDLEDDGRVTVQSIQLGEVLCESLTNAENALELQFAVGPNETFLANQNSFTVFNGSIFGDGISRKVWTGEEAENDQTEVAPRRAVSMTWGDECDVETFIFEIKRQFSNGTLIVSKTIPCEAGGPFDICFVELELELPEEGDSDEVGGEVDLSGEVRRLSYSHPHHVTEKYHKNGVEAVAPAERQLQSTTTQIDLMFLYTPGGRDILGVSDSQMQSELADSLISVNEAMVNSEIDLQFSLVRVEPLPYTEESTESSTVLGNLRDNTEVADLRDFYGADLVHLVADLDADNGGTCGRAILPTSPLEPFAFGVVDPYCFFQFSHTHEIAHNMGCYHNRDDSNTQHPYAHGYRYCDGDLPYRTLMSYACRDEDDNIVTRVNYFSNPNITFQDKPTGTTIDNCARRISETKDEVANYRDPNPVSITPTPTTIPTPAPITAPTPAPITAPSPAPTADPTRIPVIAPSPEPVVPPTPAPFQAPTLAPIPVPTPAPITAPTSPPFEAPTPVPVTASMLAPTSDPTSVPVSVPTPAPVLPPTPAPSRAPDTCSNGIAGVEWGIFCCTLGCGTCGGAGCSRRGSDEGLTEEDCCVLRIGESGVYCDNSGNAPCILGEAPASAPTPEPTTPKSTSPTPIISDSASPGPTPRTIPVIFPTPEPTFSTGGLVEVGDVTLVTVSANGYHESTSASGCAPIGCVAENTRDSSLSTRWSCKESLLDGINCKITYEFDDPQDIDIMRIAFYKGSERTRKLKVETNGSTNSVIVSSGQTDQFEDFELDVENVSEVTFEGLELGWDDWIALLEVQFILP